MKSCFYSRCITYFNQQGNMSDNTFLLYHRLLITYYNKGPQRSRIEKNIHLLQKTCSKTLEGNLRLRGVQIDDIYRTRYLGFLQTLLDPTAPIRYEGYKKYRINYSPLHIIKCCTSSYSRDSTNTSTIPIIVFADGR